MDMPPLSPPRHGRTNGPRGGPIATATTIALLAALVCVPATSAAPPQKGLVPTQLTITPSESPSYYGSDALSLTGLVTSLAGSAPTPTGSVQFHVTDADDVDPVPLDASGAAAFVPPFYLDVGDTVSADYSGDSTHSPSSGTLSASVVADATQLALSVAPNPAAVGQEVTIAADVSNLNVPDMTPFGSVVFTLDGHALDPVPLDDNGHAEVTATASTPGQVAVRAHYFDDTGVPADMVDSYASSAAVVDPPVGPSSEPASQPSGDGHGSQTNSALEVHRTAAVECIVPRLRGAKLGFARIQLRRAHCRLGAVSQARPRGNRRGRVLTTLPRAGAHRAAGARVRLIVGATGRSPAASPPRRPA